MNVPVGPTSKVGWGAAATAFLAAVLTYLTGDHSAKEVTALELGIGGGVFLLVTHGFRYVQSIIGLKLPGVGLDAVDPESLAALSAVAQANLEKVGASPDGVDGPHVAFSGQPEEGSAAPPAS